MLETDQNNTVFCFFPNTINWMTLLFFSLIIFQLQSLLGVKDTVIDPSKRFKFPNKQRPFYPIDGDYFQVGGIAVSPLTDEIFFSDAAWGQIFKISGEQVFLVAGAGGGGDGGSNSNKDGHLLSAKFVNPLGLSFHPNGTLIAVADTKQNVIKIVDLGKGVVSTLAGSPAGVDGYVNGIGAGAKFYRPYDLVFVGDMIFVADTANSVIRKIAYPAGVVTTYAGSGNKGWDLAEGIATKVSLYHPFSLFYDNDEGVLYIADSWNGAIRSVNSTGYLKTVFRNTQVLQLQWGIVKRERTLIVSDQRNDYVVAIDIDTKAWSVYAGSRNLPGLFNGQRKDAQLRGPQYLALTKAQDIVLIDNLNNAIRAISNSSGYLYTLLRQRGYGYEDGEPSKALFASRCDILFDARRSVLYVTDSINNAIRRVHVSQGCRVDTLTGKPYSGFIDGPLSEALFNTPSMMIFDPDDGNILYVGDRKNEAVRKINLTSGIVTTPTILAGPPFLMVFDALRNLYFYMPYSWVKVDAGLKGPGTIIVGSSVFDCKDGNAASAAMTTVSGAIYDSSSDEIVFADCQCYSIRSLSLTQRTVTTVAGSLGSDSDEMVDGPYGQAKFSCPYVVVSLKDDDDDKLFITDADFNAVRFLDRKKYIVGTITGAKDSGYRNGNLSTAQLFYPTGIAASALNDSIYFFDSKNMAIRAIKDGQVTTIAGQGSPIYHASFNVPTHIASSRSIAALAFNELLILDTINNCIIKIKIINEDVMDLRIVAGDGSNGWKDGTGTDSMLNRPTDIALNGDKSMAYIVDTSNHVIRQFHVSSGVLSTFAGTGYAGNDLKPGLFDSSFKEPQAITIDPRSNVLFVADSGNNCIKKINGSVISIFAGSIAAGFKNGLSTSAQFARPMGLVFDPQSECLFVADTFNHAIRRITLKRVVSTVLGINGLFGFEDGGPNTAKLNYPTKVILGRSVGELLILDSGNHAVRFLDANFNLSTLLVDPDAHLQGITVDDGGNMYVSDSKSIRVIYNPVKKSESYPVESSTNITAIVVTILCIVIITASCFICYTRSRAKRTTDVLNAIGTKRRDGNEPDQSNTLSPSHTVALAIPGYRKLNLKNSIRFPDNVQVSGKGGTAQVIRCKLKDPKLIEKHEIVDVAVKIFGKGTSKESFLYEVMIMSSLPKSPNLIELIGYSEGRELSIIMKDYPLSLKDLLEDKKFPNNNETNLKAAVDIANGMNLIHQKGMIHFDLKPANVLAEVVNGQWNFVICDFGFANFLSDVQDKIVKGVKKPTAIGITARYAAPELFAKISNQADTVAAPAEIEKKIDVYAYAMTLFYVFLRKIPMQDLLAGQIEDAVMAGERPEIPSATVPESIQKLIKSCWSQDPRDRPSFAEILAILQQ